MCASVKVLALRVIFGGPQFFPPGFNSLLPNIMLITNMRENGEPIGALPDGEMMFHHDMIRAEIPDKATFLYSLEIPSYGGDTFLRVAMPHGKH